MAWNIYTNKAFPPSRLADECHHHSFFLSSAFYLTANIEDSYRV